MHQAVPKDKKWNRNLCGYTFNVQDKICYLKSVNDAIELEDSDEFTSGRIVIGNSPNGYQKSKAFKARGFFGRFFVNSGAKKTQKISLKLSTSEARSNYCSIVFGVLLLKV